MTVTASPDTWKPLNPAAICRVYVGSKMAEGSDGGALGYRATPRDLGSVSWRYDARYQVSRVTLNSGGAPDRCVLTLPGNSEGALVTDYGLVWGVDHDNVGEELAPVLRPDGLYALDDILVTIDTPGDVEPDEVTGYPIFRGHVWSWAEDLASGLPRIVALGPRAMMEGIDVHGVQIWDKVNADYAWLGAYRPVFNRGGEPDRCDVDDIYEDNPEAPMRPCFTHRGGYTGNYWTRGDVWNYLRYHWQEIPHKHSSIPLGLNGWMNVPELSAEGHGAGMFTVPGAESGTYSRARQISLAGYDLKKAFVSLARERGNYDIAVEHGESASNLVLYGTGKSTISVSQQRITLRRGEITKKVNDDAEDGGQPEVFAGTLGYSVRRARTRVRAMGAPKRIDVTFDMSDGTLERGWLSDDEALWVALSDGSKRAGRKYGSVFRRYVIPDDIDWTDDFGLAIQLLCKRGLGARLLTSDSNAAGGPARIKVQAQYYNGGWIDCPHRFWPDGDELSVVFANGCRFGDDRWSWNGNEVSPAERDVRITVSLELDERIYTMVGSEPAGWPPLVRALVDERAYRYDARQNCHLRTHNGKPPDAETTPGRPLHDGGTMCSPVCGWPAGAEDPIRDDTDRLEAAANELRDQLARAMVTGPITVDGLRPDIRVGAYVEKVSGGGGAGRTGVTRADFPVKAVVRKIEIDNEHQQTSLHFKGD